MGIAVVPFVRKWHGRHKAVTCDHLSNATRLNIELTQIERFTMSAKTQKNWRELCRDLHNEQESGNLMDIVRELNGTLEQLVAEMKPSEGLSATPTESDPLVQSPRSAVTNRMNG
jgi:hypothetical protein